MLLPGFPVKSIPWGILKVLNSTSWLHLVRSNRLKTGQFRRLQITSLLQLLGNKSIQVGDAFRFKKASICKRIEATTSICTQSRKVHSVLCRHAVQCLAVQCSAWRPKIRSIFSSQEI
jgi:hypothetical protein